MQNNLFSCHKMKDAAFWIEKLNLQPHPEGGFYSETYRSKEIILENGLPKRYGSPRSFGTAIYFLLRSEDISAFHRIKSDELWFFHTGSATEICCLSHEGVKTIYLGSEYEKGQSFQLLVPANTWFGARVVTSESFALLSCTVAPGFAFEDFELGERTKLVMEFPESRSVIEMLTK